jgi:hypothetical protein
VRSYDISVSMHVNSCWLRNPLAHKSCLLGCSWYLHSQTHVVLSGKWIKLRMRTYFTRRCGGSGEGRLALAEVDFEAAH